MDNYYVQIAGVNIKILASNDLLKDISISLDGEINKENITSDLTLRLSNDDFTSYQPSVYSAKGSMNFNQSEYFVGYLNGINYKVKNLFNENPTELDITVSNISNINILKQLYTLDFSDRNKNIVLSYSLFWYILHIILLKKQKVFLHAGIFANNGNATVITGTGGCGKTSTLFKLLEEKNSQYISEDFGIIDYNAIAYYNPKPVSIYASDMEFGQQILKDYYKKFTTIEKILWNFKSKFLKKNPMVKALPKKVMDNRIKENEKLKNILYFVRDDSAKLSFSDIDIDELAERVLDASMRELKTLNELILLMRANAPTEYNIPSFEDIRNQTKEIYMKAFERTNNKIVYIPHKTKPDDLVAFLKDKDLI